MTLARFPALTSCAQFVQFESERPESGPLRMPLLTEGKRGAEISHTQFGPVLDERDRGQRWSAPICVRDQ